jgi:hypothetical protein
MNNRSTTYDKKLKPKGENKIIEPQGEKEYLTLKKTYG